jgi:AcrR family transcriptional regulator
MIVMKRRGAESDGRERLMDAALALFADRGYEGVAIHEIAEAAGMTRAAPYYHFQNKEDLFLATVSREMERTAAKLADAVKAAPTFRAQLIAIIETFLMVQGSSVGQFIADVKQNLSPASLKRFETCHRQTMGVLQEVFEQAHASGEYRRVSPSVAFQIFFSLAVGYMELARKNSEFIQPVDGCNPPTPDVMVDVFLSGI